jgi:hypothetical protein
MGVKNLLIEPDTTVEEVLTDKSAIMEYEKGMRFLYHHLVELNINVYLVEQIFKFPLSLFLREEAPEKSIFLRQFVDNAMSMSILGINKLIIDKKSDLYTLKNFQRRVRVLMKADYHEAYDKIINDNQMLERQVKYILDKAKDVRDNQLAHLTQEAFQEAFDSKLKNNQIYLRDIKLIREKLNRCFSNLGFGTEYLMLPTCYQDSKSFGHKSDIEEILDNIAKDSHILNLPEKSLDRWNVVFPILTEADLQQLNRYREKFGKSKV